MYINLITLRSMLKPKRDEESRLRLLQLLLKYGQFFWDSWSVVICGDAWHLFDRLDVQSLFTADTRTTF